jgi:hypothetical protein
MCPPERHGLPVKSIDRLDLPLERYDILAHQDLRQCRTWAFNKKERMAQMVSSAVSRDTISPRYNARGRRRERCWDRGGACPN